MTSLNERLLELSNSGMTPEQISDTTGYDVEAIKIALTAIINYKPLSAEQLIEKYRPEMINILIDIARDTDKKDSDRVKAASVIIDTKTFIPDNDIDSLSERLQKMKKIVDKARGELSPKMLEADCLAV